MFREAKMIIANEKNRNNQNSVMEKVLRNILRIFLPFIGILRGLI